MQTFRPGEVILLDYPYSNFEETKRRPALVLLDSRDEDIVIARITSRPYSESFDVQVHDWKQAGLMVPSVVRVNKILTVAKHLVEQQIGKLSDADWSKTTQALQRLWRELFPTS